MTDRLSLYNKALLYCSETPLASLADDAVARHVLDAVWDGGAVAKILEEGYWNTALRTLELDFDTDVEPPFGYARAFRHPDDLIRVNALTTDPYLTEPLLRYLDEAGYWYADVDCLYVSYVSEDPAFGGDLARWPASLAEAAARWLASVAAHGFNKAEAQIQRMELAAERAFTVARSRDAMNQPTRFPPAGRWTTARRGFGGQGRDPHSRCG